MTDKLDEARMSAAVKLQRAFEREQEKSAASRARGQALLDKAKQDAAKKEEPKKVDEHIVKVAGGYELKSKKTGRNLGKYPSKAGAEKRERQVQYFKHVNEEEKKKAEKPEPPPTPVHQIGVIVSQPDHPMEKNRDKQIQKFIRVATKSQADAIRRAKQHFEYGGFTVHDTYHHSMVEETEMNESSTPYWKKQSWNAKMSKLAKQERLAREKKEAESKQVKEDLDEGLKPEHNMRPGWMLKADPELAAKVKKNKEIAKARKASYGNPAAGKSVKEEADLEEGRNYHDNRTGFAKRRREDDEYHVPDPVTRTHKIGFHVSKEGGEKHHRTVTISNTTKSHGEAHAAARAHLEKQGYKIHEELELEESMTDSWKAVQSMDKGSVTGGKEEAKKRLAYLNAVHDHHKRFGNDTKKVRKEIENINRSRVAEEVEQIDEISSKLAGNYYGAATKKHIEKVGVKKDMYNRIEKDMGKNRKAGVDRALDRITGARKTNEELVMEGAYEKAEENKKSADAAKKQGDMFAHHLHMADHHDNMAEWHASKGRHGEADRHAEKSEQHHEKAMSLKEGYVPDHSGQLNKKDSQTMSKLAALMAKEKAAKAAKAAKTVKEEAEQLDERNKENATKRKMMDASRGARYKAAGNPVPDREEGHKTAQQHNKAIGRALRKEDTEQVDEKLDMKTASMKQVIDDFADSNAPQFQGKSGAKRRQMAIAAKLKGERTMKEQINSFKSYLEEELDEAAWPGTPEYKAKFGDTSRGKVGTQTHGSKGTQTVTATGVKHERNYEKAEKETGETEKQEKRGRGRPKGSASGARQKGSAAKGDNSKADYTGFKLHLPSRN